MRELLHTEGVRVPIGAGMVVVDRRVTVATGDVLAVLGPNGSGKSTLLEALAGLRDSEGAIERTPHLGFVPQRPVLFSGSVLRNAGLGLRMQGIGREEATVRGRASLKAFGVEHLSGRRAAELSVGEARRVALARAIAPDPDLLFLDEPFGGLDTPSRDRLLDDVVGRLTRVGRREATERGIVIVSHDPEDVVATADRVLMLVGGRVAQIGEVEEVFSRPADETVAGLVGAENVVFGRVVGDAGPVMRIDCGSFVLEATGVADPGDRVAVVIRPESVTVLDATETRHGSARNLLQGVVESVQRRASVARVLLEVSGVRLVATVVPDSVDDLGLGAGKRVAIAIKATAAHVVERAAPKPSSVT